MGQFQFSPGTFRPVIPASAGIQMLKRLFPLWIPACAGMTGSQVLGKSQRAPLPGGVEFVELMAE